MVDNNTGEKEMMGERTCMEKMNKNISSFLKVIIGLHYEVDEPSVRKGTRNPLERAISSR